MGEHGKGGGGGLETQLGTTARPQQHEYETGSPNNMAQQSRELGATRRSEGPAGIVSPKAKHQEGFFLPCVTQPHDCPTYLSPLDFNGESVCDPSEHCSWEWVSHMADLSPKICQKYPKNAHFWPSTCFEGALCIGTN